MTAWFTADLHFGHANIIKYCCRPFATAAAMDQALLDNLNAAVAPEDTLYFLGDFSLGSRQHYLRNAAQYRQRIRCRDVRLVWGNHDRPTEPGFLGLFTTADEQSEIEIDGQRLVLCHYPLRTWTKSSRGCHLFGHHHGTWVDRVGVSAFDVGVDCWDYQPLSLEHIRAVLDYKSKGGLAADLTLEFGRLVRRDGRPL